MNNIQEKINKASKISAYLTAILIFGAGICFILTALNIYYNGGNAPYTPESVANHFKMIRIPVLITVFSLLASGILHLLNEKKCKTDKGSVSIYKLLEKQKERLNGFECNEETVNILTREAKKRAVIRIISITSTFVFLLLAFIIAVSTEYSTENINGVVIGLCMTSNALSIGAICIIFVSSILCQSSAKDELDVMKKEYARLVSKGIKASETPINNKNIGILQRFSTFFESHVKIFTNITRCTILIIAVLLIVLGITNGSMADVLGKAVRICTECIGLG